MAMAGEEDQAENEDMKDVPVEKELLKVFRHIRK